MLLTGVYLYVSSSIQSSKTVTIITIVSFLSFFHIYPRKEKRLIQFYFVDLSVRSRLASPRLHNRLCQISRWFKFLRDNRGLFLNICYGATYQALTRTITSAVHAWGPFHATHNTDDNCPVSHRPLLIRHNHCTDSTYSLGSGCTAPLNRSFSGNSSLTPGASSSRNLLCNCAYGISSSSSHSLSSSSSLSKRYTCAFLLPACSLHFFRLLDNRDTVAGNRSSPLSSRGCSVLRGLTFSCEDRFVLGDPILHIANTFTLYNWPKDARPHDMSSISEVLLALWPLCLLLFPGGPIGVSRTLFLLRGVGYPQFTVPLRRTPSSLMPELATNCTVRLPRSWIASIIGPVWA
ncbi:unnamed protein product [Acanthosepion pharaonis]|uniref:Uncharacterized protein n=1 Tax=Acanthosepion pharaonis TaxID=158019 RepID=A0A812DP38_ACAPH|nr:unnamed protein product [Sepia pharaonis]